MLAALPVTNMANHRLISHSKIHGINSKNNSDQDPLGSRQIKYIDFGKIYVAGN